MTFLEALFVAILAISFVKWHYRGHLTELERRIQALSVQIAEVGSRNLNTEQKDVLNKAVKKLALARQLQKEEKIEQADQAVSLGLIFVHAAKSSVNAHNLLSDNDTKDTK